MMILKKLFLFSLLVLSSCSTTNQELDPKIFYIRDLQISVNGADRIGVAVISKRDSHKFKIKSQGKMDLLAIETCHRQITLEEVGFKEGYIYEPIKGIEDQPNCAVIKFSSFERKKGRHAEGILIMENEAFKLPAIIKCNGIEKKYYGTSVCHSKEFLYQVIEFDEPVKIFETNCSLKSLDGLKKIRFSMPNRDCRFLFMSSDGRKHIMYTSGYEQILIRE